MKTNDRTENLLEALRHIELILGPAVPDSKHLACEGCREEWAEALETAQQALIENQQSTP
jgi:hypothetical protein